MSRIKVALRTPQAAYLESLARWDDSTVTRALASIIERHVAIADAGVPSIPPRPARKETRHVCIDPDHLAFVDRLAVEWGLSRSDVVRRLIDQALADESGSQWAKATHAA